MGDIGIVAFFRLVDRPQPVGTNGDQPFGAGGQANDKLAFDVIQFTRHRAARHKGNIDGLVPFVGQIDAGGCLGRARHTYKDDVRLRHVLRQLAIVMRHGELQRINAFKIMGVQFMLPSRFVRCLHTKIRPQKIDHGVKNRQDRQAGIHRFPLQRVPDLGVDQCIHDKAGLLADIFHQAAHLHGRTHQRPIMFFNINAFKLHERRLHNGFKRFTCGIGDKMQVKFIIPVRNSRRGGDQIGAVFSIWNRWKTHGNSLWITC